MDINNLSLVELKALAYDLLAQAQHTEKQLIAVNKLIEEKSVKPEEVKTEE